MTSTAHPKGSMWRIWDLHVHTPASYGGDYENFIENASASIASVIGINDYCSIAGYEAIQKLGGIPKKVIFPVVELRMHNLLHTRKNPNGIRLNFHVIFDNAPEIYTTITTWLQSLHCFDADAQPKMLGAIKPEDLQNVSFDYEAIVESLKKYGLYGTNALIWLPYDEYGGADEINPASDGFFKMALIRKAHIMGSSTAKQIEYFKFADPKFSIDQYRSWFDAPKPCIKGSDSHKNTYPIGCLQDKHSQPTTKYCWINADTTFDGLKQIVNEPDRVFIGEEPPLLQRIKSNKTKFIQSLNISLVPGASVIDTWFKNFSIYLNSGLVAIIGNKGGGKSAITDIISLCGNTHQDALSFSFLMKDKFRRVKPENLSEKFEALLRWEDGSEQKRTLSQNPDKNFPQRVKYIPQHFLEQLCSNVESDQFEKELKQIIFSHTPVEKKLGKSTLDELISYRSDIVISDMALLHQQLANLNVKIVELENKATKEFLQGVENQIKLKQGELGSHEQNKPVPPSEEVANNEKQKAIVDELTELRGRIAQLEKTLAGLGFEKRELSLKKGELDRALQNYRSLQIQLQKFVDPADEFVTILTKHGLDVNTVVKFTIDTSSISTLIERVNVREMAIDATLDTLVEGTDAHKLQVAKATLQKGQEDLDRPALAHQKYLDDLKSWEVRKQELEGSKETEGTLNQLSFFVDYLKNKLSTDLNAKYEDRLGLARKLYEKKAELLAIRKELFQPVMQYIEDFKELKQRYDVKIDVSLEVRGFSDGFFSNIGQNRVGTYNGKEEGYKKLNDLLERSQFDNAEDFIRFTDDVLSSLRFDKRGADPKPVIVANQLKQGAELNKFYDFLFGAEFVQPLYSLKLGNKTLQQLSPGERGALLLIFYLILDKDDIPLIIDQPEENLDNESVYYILVHFIKKAKETRQIIIVTHNPNLAIVCDADQIIHMHIDKENKNAVCVISGAIENPAINRSVINILEGTLPAFNNRDSKYLRTSVAPVRILEPALTQGVTETEPKI